MTSMLNRLIFVALFLLAVCGWAIGQSCTGLKNMSTPELISQTQVSATRWDTPSCERLSHDLPDLVFSAVATKVIAHDGQLLLDGHCTKTTLQTVSLRKLESFRGDVPTQVVAQAGGINGFYFKMGKQYLIFAHKQTNGTFIVSGASQTALLADAREDERYLRSYAGLPQTSDIYGTGMRGPKGVDEARLLVPRMEPIAGSLITLTGPVQREQRLDRDGKYHFTDLPPGQYSVEIHTGPNVRGGSKRTVTVQPRGCALVNFAEYSNNPELTQQWKAHP